MFPVWRSDRGDGQETSDAIGQHPDAGIVDVVLFLDQHLSPVQQPMFGRPQRWLDGGSGNLNFVRLHSPAHLNTSQVLTYVAEVTQPQFRGMLAASGTTCVITGILVQFVLGAFMSWRMVSLTCIGLPLFTILALCFIPESPYWLLTKGRVTEARDSLAWLRGWLDHTHTEHEFNEIKDILLKKKEEADELAAKPFHYRFQPYTRQSFIAPFLLISATFFIGHFSGKTPLQTYAVQVSAKAYVG